MNHAVLIDFGSTYTKVACVHIKERRVLMTDRFPSTVHTDARICLHRCLDAARSELGGGAFAAARRLASSSAAGGLRMAVIGLTRTLSAVAGKHTACGAGGKIVANCCGRLTAEDVERMQTARVEIILLCGGYEQGNRALVLENAALLAQSRLTAPVLYAGNSAVAQEVRALLRQGGKECFLVRNVIPAIGLLDTAPAEQVIRHLFLQRITHMMGMERVQEELGGVLMPTPAAVLAAGALLSQGTGEEAGLGPLLMADVGGATTDIYSYCENRSHQGAKCIGAAEPFAKRTVEGDMGMRESAASLLEEVGGAALAQAAAVTEERLAEGICRRVDERDYLANCDEERRIDRALGRCAVAVSVRRHAGRVETVRTSGSRNNQLGKNLTDVRMIVGTGGVLVNGASPEELLQAAALRAGESEAVLVPRAVECRVDRAYSFYAAGLLAAYDKKAALAIMKQSIGW